MKLLEIKYSSLDEINDVADKIISFSNGSKIWLFDGELGVGKTTLIKSICSKLLVEDNVTSPTYTIVNEYRTQKGTVIFHFDFFRLKNEYEAMDIGYEEYFYSGNYCFVEWPRKIKSLIPSEFLNIKITLGANEMRNLVIKKIFATKTQRNTKRI